MRQSLSPLKMMKIGKIARFIARKGGFLCLEDERTRSIREDPKSFTTLGFGEEVQVLTPQSPLDFASSENFVCSS
jgi:hypothetical protein